MYIYEILEELLNFDNDMKVKVSDGRFLTKEFGSDRGDYYDMYIGISDEKSDNTIHTILDLKNLIGEALNVGVMYGYKGGEFEINNYTKVTIGGYGYSGNEISDIREKDGVVYIIYETMTEIWSRMINDKIQKFLDISQIILLIGLLGLLIYLIVVS